jgi:fucose 4-O-acetylase-like acetyltransferase
MITFFKQFKSIQQAEIGSYSPVLNAIKGLLVIIVIFGHAINITSKFQTVYFFHMPLFLSISGFLVKKSAFDEGIFPYFKKFFNRAIIPWLIAFVVFIPIAFYNKLFATFSVKDILYPYYHLWYIPAYILGVCVCFLVVKYKIPYWLMLIVLGIISCCWFIIYRDSSPDNLPLFYLGEKRIYGYLTFFFLGFAIRNKEIKWRPNPYLLMVIISLTGLVILAFIAKHMQSNGLLLVTPYLICNIGLGFFTLIYLSSQNWTNNKFIHFVNNQSLGIYLYHPLFIFMAYQALNDPQMNKLNDLYGSIIFVLSTLLSTALIWLLTQFEITNRYVLGNTKKIINK